MLKLKVLKKNSDNTADVLFDYDSSFEQYYKSKTNSQVVETKRVGQYIKDMIFEACTATPKTVSV